MLSESHSKILLSRDVLFVAKHFVFSFVFNYWSTESTAESGVFTSASPEIKAVVIHRSLKHRNSNPELYSMKEICCETKENDLTS